MNSKRHYGVLALSLAGALAFTGCGDDDDTRDTGPGNQPDAGTGPADTGGGSVDMGNTGPIDMGTDAGMGGPDMGTGDMGASDGGGSGGGRAEGESCGQNSPCVDGLACVTFGGENSISVCLDVCQSSADCADPASTLLPPAETCGWEGVLQDGDGNTFGYCVQEVGNEGDVILSQPDPTLIAQGQAIGACSEATSAIAINDDQARCVLQCDDDTDCAQSGISATSCGGGICVQDASVGEGQTAVISETQLQGCAEGLTRFASDTPGGVDCARVCASDNDCTTQGIGFCNLNNGTFTSTAITGVCTRRAGVHGQPCSNSHIVEGCSLDRTGNGVIFCSDPFGIVNDMEPLEGICTGFCGDLDQDPMTPDETCRNAPTGAMQTCVTTTDDGMPLFQAQGVGLCSDGCSQSPNNCGGEEPTSCWVQSNPQIPITYSQCLFPAEPVLEAWYPALGAPNMSQDCSDAQNRCPANTFCVGVTGGAACIYGCDADPNATQSGCEGVTIDGQSNLTCTRINQNSTDGFCAPM